MILLCWLQQQSSALLGSRRLTGVLGFGLFCLLLAWLFSYGGQWLCDRLLPLDTWKQQAEAQASSKFHLSLRSEALHVRPTVFSGLQVWIDRPVLLEPETRTWLKARRVSVNVAWWPLLTQQKAKIGQIRLHDLHAFVPQAAFQHRWTLPPADPNSRVVLDGVKLVSRRYHLVVYHTAFGPNFVSKGLHWHGKNLEVRGLGSSVFIQGSPVAGHELTLRGQFSAKQKTASVQQFSWRDVTPGHHLERLRWQGQLSWPDYRQGHGELTLKYLPLNMLDQTGLAHLLRLPVTFSGGWLSGVVTLKAGALSGQLQLKQAQGQYVDKVSLPFRQMNATVSANMAANAHMQQWQCQQASGWLAGQPFLLEAAGHASTLSAKLVLQPQRLERLLPAKLLKGLTGQHQATFLFSGTLAQLRQGRNITGQWVGEALTLPGWGTVPKAVITVSPTQITLAKTNARVWDTPLTLSGQWFADSKTVQAVLDAPRIDLKHLQQQLKQHSSAAAFTAWPVSAQGFASLKLSARGPVTAPVFDWQWAMDSAARVHMALEGQPEAVLAHWQGQGQYVGLPKSFWQTALQHFNIRGDYNQTPISITGNDATQLALETGWLDVATLPVSVPRRTSLSGLSGKVRLKGVLGWSAAQRYPTLSSAQLEAQQLQYASEQQGLPMLQLPALQAHWAGARWTIDPTHGLLGSDIPFQLSGSSAKGLTLSLNQPVSLAAIRDIYQAQKPALQVRTNRLWPDWWQAGGTVRGTITVSPEQQLAAALTVDDGLVSWAGGAFPLHQLNGTVRVLSTQLQRLRGQLPEISTEQFALLWGDSPVVLKGHGASSQWTVAGQGALSKMVLSHLTAALFPQARPFPWLLSETAFELSAESQNQRQGQLRAFFPQWLQDPLSAQWFMGNTQEGLTVSVPESVVHLPVEHAQLVTLQARFNTLMTPTPHLTMSVKTESDALQADITGEFRPYPGGMSRFQGFLKANDFSWPLMKFSHVTGDITLNEQQAQLAIQDIAFPGGRLAVQATCPNLLAYPLLLEPLQITGKSFEVEGYQRYLQVLDKTVFKVYGRPRSFLALEQTQAPVVPFYFRAQPVAVDEFVFQNILMEKLNGKFSLYPNAFFELTDAHAQVAGGTVTGGVSMNPYDRNFLSVSIEPKQVKANALMVALLNQPNQVFGELDGRIQFTTQGDTQLQMAQNTNGLMSFDINNARLPEIAKIETLLTAANVIRGGLLGLNLNNVFRAISPFQTNYFAKLSGQFQMAEGVMYTQNLLADGHDLDLNVTGGIRLSDGVANLQVHGAMSQNVSGRLGALGRLSLGSLVGYIPGLGFIPVAGEHGMKRHRGLLGYVPGLGFVPGLGGLPSQQNKFTVSIQGALDDPGAVQNLQWEN